MRMTYMYVCIIYVRAIIYLPFFQLQTVIADLVRVEGGSYKVTVYLERSSKEFSSGLGRVLTLLQKFLSMTI